MQVDTLNKLVTKYNEQSYEEHMKATLGVEGWERFKPTRNLSDFLSSRANDNVKGA